MRLGLLSQLLEESEGGETLRSIKADWQGQGKARMPVRR